MAGKCFQNDRVVRSYLVEGIPIHCEIAASPPSYLAVAERPCRRLQPGCGNRSLHFRAGRIWALEFQVNAIGVENGDVVMCVVDSWNYGAPVEVDLLRVRSGKGPNFRRTSGRGDSLPTDRESLHIGMCGVAGKDLSVEQNHVWWRLLASHRDRRERQEKDGARFD